VVRSKQRRSDCASKHSHLVVVSNCVEVEVELEGADEFKLHRHGSEEAERDIRPRHQGHTLVPFLKRSHLLQRD
jgi:hypothetical protein